MKNILIAITILITLVQICTVAFASEEAIIRVNMPLKTAVKIIESVYGQSGDYLAIMPPKMPNGNEMALKEYKISEKRFLVLCYSNVKGEEVVLQILLFAVPTKNKLDVVEFRVREINLKNL